MCIGGCAAGESNWQRRCGRLQTVEASAHQESGESAPRNEFVQRPARDPLEDTAPPRRRAAARAAGRSPCACLTCVSNVSAIAEVGCVNHYRVAVHHSESAPAKRVLMEHVRVELHVIKTHHFEFILRIIWAVGADGWLLSPALQHPPGLAARYKAIKRVYPVTAIKHLRLRGGESGAQQI
ncbi:hypothetical protein EVAR_43499_1 [Eumeta japonica]|uniref:Uncharacterized protein n=1 Tax=Eumeta variegata TaxID=151549 RepID=A0A4C1YJY9_EUMVA|nr:hypothetical protein EVAR_43499_1 [Eumeta japonica]